MATIAVTGAASGIGAATTARLRADGHSVITVDLHDADINGDLGTPEGRQAAIEGVTERSGGSLDGLVPLAGVAGFPGRPGSVVVAINYFGTVSLLAGLRGLLARGTNPSAVAISSNSTTAQPNYSAALVEACLSGDEAEARRLADLDDSVNAYPASKLGVARWVRRNAITPDWIGAGIRLNAIAPGLIETPMIAEGRSVPALAEALKLFPIPIGRGGRPEEMANLIAFLLGSDSTFFVGSIVFSDGGTDALLRANDWPAIWQLPPA